jgi:hypothetical protein
MIETLRSAAILSAAWILLTAVTASSSPGQPATLPPVAGEWTRTDSVDVYAGKDLFLLVDGGADLFIEYGFVRVLTSEYSRVPDQSVTTELYEMESPAAAYGLFTSFTVGTGAAAPVGQEAVLGEGYCIFWKGSYVGMLTAASVDSGSGQMLLQLVGELETEIRHTGSLPGLCTLLREAGLDSRTMVFVRGKLALGNQLPYAWVTSLPPAEGVLGESGTSRYLILDYADAAAAAAALRTAGAEWERSQVPVTLDSGGKWTIRQRKEEVAVLERQGRYVLAVSGAREKSEAMASRLRRILGASD